jgi:UDP-glucose 4-epimerase
MISGRLAPNIVSTGGREQETLLSIYAITGGAGFLGSALAERLGWAGHQVRVLDDFSDPAARGRAEVLRTFPTVTITEGDVCDPSACRNLCAGAEFVLHFAVPRLETTDAGCVNVILGGTLALLAAAQGARRLIVASSSAVYGDSPSPIRHEGALPDPDTSYACAQLSAEHFCRAAFRRDGLQTVCLRFFEVYGPGMTLEGSSASRMARLIQAVLTGEAVAITSADGQARDAIYVSDAVEATLRAAEAVRGVGGKVFNVGTGRAQSDAQVREILEHLTGRSLATYASGERSEDARQGRADTTAAAGLLQFTADVPLEEGLARTLQWAKSTIRTQELCTV